MITRRFMLGSAIATLAGAAIGDLLTRPGLAAETFAFTRTDAEWRNHLSADQYAVLRKNATETPYTSPLLGEKRRGTFVCAGCDRDLFASATKYDSKTGWPSFWQALDKAVGTEKDSSFGMTRVAVHCNRCGGHLGHLFDDGPAPTRLRYCINGIALGFKPATA